MKKLSKEQFETIKHRYQSGESLTDIHRDLKYSRSFIKKNLIKQGVRLRTRSECNIFAHQKEGYNNRKYCIDESVFESLTEESAYWIGFLMADGCVYNTKVSLSLQYRDVDHIEKFRTFLKSNHPISIRDLPLPLINPKSESSEKLYRQACFTFSSAKMVKTLKNFGVVPKKSLIAKVSGLESNRHFWRGVIDGDGSIGIEKNRGDAAYISLVGSQSLMNQFLVFVKSIVETKAAVGFCSKTSATYTVSLSFNKAFQVISTLYSDCNIYLDRKHESFQIIKQKHAIVEQKQADLDKLTIKIGQLYIQGISGVKIANELNIGTVRVYKHLIRFEKITGQKCPRRHKTRQLLSTAQKYRLAGKCKECGKETAPNCSRCEFHLTKARNWWRKKHGQNLSYNTA